MYEARHQLPLSNRRFFLRMLWHGVLVLSMLGASLGVGMLGYHGLEGLDWLDSFLNAAMLLGGMGPLHAPVTVAGKWFAGCFALYAGLVFLATATLLVVPVAHRLLHRMHFAESPKGDTRSHSARAALAHPDSAPVSDRRRDTAERGT